MFVLLCSLCGDTTCGCESVEERAVASWEEALAAAGWATAWTLFFPRPETDEGAFAPPANIRTRDCRMLMMDHGKCWQRGQLVT